MSNGTIVHRTGIILDAEIAAGLKGSLRVYRGRPILKVYVGTHRGTSKHRQFQLGRVLLGLQYGDPREVDHINRNPLDNRLTNLRIVTPEQNRQNREAGRRKHWPAGLPKARGVTYTRSGKYKVHMVLAKRTVFCRTYSSLEEAAAVANRLRREHMPFHYDDGGRVAVGNRD